MKYFHFKLYSQTLSLSVIFFLLCGIALTADGLIRMSWPQAIPWNIGGVKRLLGFLFVTGFFLYVINRIFIKNIYLSAGVAALCLAIISGATWSLFVVLGFLVAASLIGQWVLLNLKMSDESWLISFLVGSAVFGTLIQVSAHYPINYPGTYGIALFLPIILGRDMLKKWILKFYQWCSATSSHSNVPMKYMDFLIILLGLIYIVVAFMPEVGHDALAAHLFIPFHMLDRHQWGFDTNTYVWAVIPAFGDWIFSIVFMLGGETSARLVNVIFIFTLCWLIREITKWSGGSANSVRWAIIIFLSSPLVFAEGNSLFIDSIWTTYAVAGTLSILKIACDKESNGNQFIISGILLGAALATKVLTFILFPALFLVLLIAYKNWLQAKNLKKILVGTLALLVVGGGAYLYAWYVTDNPVFPFYNKLFKSPYFPIENFIDGRWNKGLTWDFLYKATFKSGEYLEAMPGVAGFQWLLIFLPSLICLMLSRHKPGLILFVVSLLSIALCFTSTAYLRYIFPAYVILIACCGIGISSILKISKIHAIIFNVIGSFVVFLNLLFLSAGFGAYQDFPIESIFSGSSKERYLAQRLPLRSAVQLVNAINLNRSPVAVFSSPQVAGINADALYANWYNGGWRAKVINVHDAQDAADLLIQSNVNFVITDEPTPDLVVALGFIKEVTLPVASFGSIGVRKLNDKYRFNKELLLNPLFSTVEGWNFHGSATHDLKSKTILVNLSSPATQNINVLSGISYRNEVTARCPNTGCLVRIQVNWKDQNGKDIKADIKVFEGSSDWKSYSMDVNAPVDARKAEIFLTAHNEIWVDYASASLKQ